jgi:hypothetical protein
VGNDWGINPPQLFEEGFLFGELIASIKEPGLNPLAKVTLRELLSVKPTDNHKII